MRNATTAIKRRREHQGCNRYTPPVERVDTAIEDDLAKLSDEELNALL